MVEKLNAKRAALLAEEGKLLAEVEKVRFKIGVVDELIAEETPVEAPVDTPVKRNPESIVITPL